MLVFLFLGLSVCLCFLTVPVVLIEYKTGLMGKAKRKRIKIQMKEQGLTPMPL